eukprot:TRINITY_DN14017_c0_g1_i1.p1 TRINITY_DN14017_c0_g1~~TRINITY_DN14017_c0_g1_i1.p1  ORF type:complete len:593 (-),score=126.87 TRINITY_DN14017_c0_g1_i1:241-2019(-)
MRRDVSVAAAAVFLLALAATASAAVNWETLTADQLRAVSLSEFQNVTWRQINSIPPQALAGLQMEQVAAMDDLACYGFTANQVGFMQPGAFGGMSYGCVFDCRVEMWTAVNASQMQNISADAIGGIQLDQWNVIPASALTKLTAEQGGGFLNFNLCRVFTDEQFAAFPWPFIANLEGRGCVKVIPPEAYSSMLPIQMRGLQKRLQFVNPDGFFNMNPDVWSYLDEGLEYVCPWLEPAWVTRLKSSLFYKFPPSCAKDMPIDAWEAISAAQISQVPLSIYSDSLTWTLIVLLHDNAIGAIGEDSWNVLGYKMNSTILDLDTKQIFRLIMAAPKILNYEVERRTPRKPFNTAALLALKAAVENNSTMQIVPFPKDEEISLFDGWTWMHFTFLNSSTVSRKTGMKAMQQTRIDSSSVAMDWISFSGIRASSVAALFSNVSLLAETNATLAAQILVDTFSNFTADMINDMKAIAAVPASSWAGVAASEFGKIKFEVWRTVSESIIQDMTCAQVNEVDRQHLYELFHENETDPVVDAFRVALDRCGLWRPTLSNWKIAALIVGVGVGACVVAVILVGGVVFIIRRRRGAESTPLLVQ